MGLKMSNEDDSCPKCGQLGGFHFVCPVECNKCGYVGYLEKAHGCPACYAWDVFMEMTSEERFEMKGLLSER